MASQQEQHECSEALKSTSIEPFVQSSAARDELQTMNDESGSDEPSSAEEADETQVQSIISMSVSDADLQNRILFQPLPCPVGSHSAFCEGADVAGFEQIDSDAMSLQELSEDESKLYDAKERAVYDNYAREHFGRRYSKTINRLLKRAIISHPVKHASLIRSTTCETILLLFKMFQFNDDQYMIYFEGFSCEMLAAPDNDPMLLMRDVTFHVESVVEETSMHCYNDFHFFGKPVLTIDGCRCPIVSGSRFPRVGFYQKAHG